MHVFSVQLCAVKGTRLTRIAVGGHLLLVTSTDKACIHPRDTAEWCGFLVAVAVHAPYPRVSSTASGGQRMHTLTLHVLFMCPPA